MRLRHSIIFWLGIFPVLVLSWAWADSARHRTRWTLCADPYHERFVILEDGALRIGRIDLNLEEKRDTAIEARHVRPLTPWYGKLARMEAGIAQDDIYPCRLAVFIHTRYPGVLSLRASSDIWHLWKLLTWYLPPWLLLLGWSYRRIGRRLKKAEVAAAGPAA